MENPPLVSIGIASFNNANYIADTLNSILKQSYKNLEVLVVDDASTDHSVREIKKWINANKVNYKFFVNEQNEGLVRTANKLLAHATGKYFILFGSDDLMLKEHVAESVSIFEEFENKNIFPAFIASSVIRINSKGDIVDPIEQNQCSIGKVQCYVDGYADLVLGHIKITAPGVILRTDFVKKVGYADKYYMEDLPLWLNLSKKYAFCIYTKVNIYYRIHSGSLMHNKTAKILEETIQLFLDELSHLNDSKLIHLLTGRIRDKCFQLYKYDSSKSIYLLNKLNGKRFSLITAVYIILLRIGLGRIILHF